MRLDSWRFFDYWLLAVVLILTIFGVAMIDSAIAGNIELIENNAVGRQILFGALGFGVIIIATLLDYHIWIAAGRVLYVSLFLFLVSVLTSGEAAFGSQRSIFGIQPSELVKITIILVLADFFSRNRDETNEIFTVLRSGIITCVLVSLIIVQPDLSTSIVVIVLWGALLSANGLKPKTIAVFAAVGLLLPFITFPLLQDYQQARIAQFLFPDPEARFGEEYNVVQAQITIGSGGWLGQGYGQGSQVQLRFLKVRHSDFIFSALAEEFGFIGTVIIMALILFVILRCLRAARLAQDMYGALICYGVATLFAFQTVVNIGMNLNLLPVTGLPLPFISHGGSSLLSLMLGIGLVESVVSRQRIQYT
ncbi:MAG: rod shape-determining protein RodA [Chloroflexota bacterium]